MAAPSGGQRPHCDRRALGGLCARRERGRHRAGRRARRQLLLGERAPLQYLRYRASTREVQRLQAGPGQCNALRRDVQARTGRRIRARQNARSHQRPPAARRQHCGHAPGSQARKCLALFGGTARSAFRLPCRGAAGDLVSQPPRLFADRVMPRLRVCRQVRALRRLAHLSQRRGLPQMPLLRHKI